MSGWMVRCCALLVWTTSAVFSCWFSLILPPSSPAEPSSSWVLHLSFDIGCPQQTLGGIIWPLTPGAGFQLDDVQVSLLCLSLGLWKSCDPSMWPIGDPYEPRKLRLKLSVPLRLITLHRHSTSAIAIPFYAEMVYAALIPKIPEQEMKDISLHLFLFSL